MTERLVSARELAGLLGLSTATVLDWFEADRLPGFKLGGRAVRFLAERAGATTRVGEDGQRRYRLG